MKVFLLCLIIRIKCLTYFVRAVLSHFRPVQLFATPRTLARQAPLSMGFSRQEDWSGLPLPPPGIKSKSSMASALHGDSLPLIHQGSPIESSIPNRYLSFLPSAHLLPTYTALHVVSKPCSNMVAYYFY